MRYLLYYSNADSFHGCHGVGIGHRARCRSDGHFRNDAAGGESGAHPAPVGCHFSRCVGINGDTLACCSAVDGAIDVGGVVAGHDGHCAHGGSTEGDAVTAIDARHTFGYTGRICCSLVAFTPPFFA